MSIQLVDATVIVNNDAVAIVPNSLEFDEGLGEQDVKAASAGGGEIEQVYIQNVESNFSMVSFSIYPTVDNIANARAWKVNLNQNVVQITGTTPDGKAIDRTFTQAALINNYKVGIGADGEISLEFKSNKAI